MSLNDLLAELSELNVKLWVDGDQLRIRAPKGVLTPEHRNILSEQKENLLHLLGQHNLDTNENSSPLVPISRGKNLPLSYSQQRLWLLAQLEPDSPVYNLPISWCLVGPLDTDSLKQSILEIARRHEILRTTFPNKNGHPVQVISPNVSVTIALEDLQELPENVRTEKINQLITENVKRPFNLTKGPLWRVQLLHLTSEEYILQLTIHHLIFDGWSMGVFSHELNSLYKSFLCQGTSSLPDLPIQYVDFVYWQTQYLQDGVLDTCRSYWEKHLGGNLSALQLPTDKPKPATQTYRGERQSLVLPQKLTMALKQLSQQEGVSLFMTLLAAFKTLLYCYSGQEDIIICSPIANRSRSELEGLIGYINNIVLMRTNLSGDPSFLQIMGRVKEVASGAYRYQDLPFQELTSFQNLANIPLSRSIFALQNASGQALELTDVTVSSLDVDTGTANFDLSLSIEERDDHMTGIFEYRIDLFNKTTITELIQNFQTLLEHVVTHSKSHLSSLPSLISIEHHRILSETENSSDSQLTFELIEHESTEILVAPRDDIERQLTTLWESILASKSIGIHDNFFELGGDSLRAVHLFTQIEEYFNKKLSLSTLFQAPTIEQLATIIRQEEWTEPWTSLVKIQAGNDKRPPLFCIHGGGFNVLIYHDLAKNLGPDQPVYGLQAQGLDGEMAIPERYNDMAENYIRYIRSIQPEGPYLLAGISAGGTIGLEMAQQLQQQGQTVALLAMFDTPGPDDYGKVLPTLPRLFSVLKYTFRYSIPRFISRRMERGPKTMLTDMLSELVKISQWVSSDEDSQEISKQLEAEGMINHTENLSVKRMGSLEQLVHKLNMFIIKRSQLAYLAPQAEIYGSGGTLADTVKKLEAAHLKAWSSYVHKPYSGNITIFRAQEQPPGFYHDSQFGWGSIAKGDLEIHDMPGYHADIVKSSVIAEKLRTCIDKALKISVVRQM